jgi:hypothetical protein
MARAFEADRLSGGHGGGEAREGHMQSVQQTTGAIVVPNFGERPLGPDATAGV